ncbi:MAG: FHA domain-containing protein [Anaerolineae bacterium]|nr:MAG: FHA domain-containing protein [Anaerolineae bacterium]
MSAWLFLFLRLVLTVVLYAFLGVALWAIWRDLQSRKPALGISPLYLEILQAGETTRRRFSAPEVSIGRAPQNLCRLDSSTVSARHARLFFRQGHWWLEDLGSTNGTYLNAERVEKAVIVVEGDKIRCGEIALRVLGSDHPSTDNS